MYTNRNIYDQHGQLLFRKKQLGNAENQNSPSDNQDIFFGSPSHSQSEHLSHTLNVSDAMTDTDITSHIKCLFQPKDDNIFEHPLAIIRKLVLNPHYELLSFFMNTLRCQYEWVYTHSVNVALFSLMIADKLGLDEEELATLAFGALLHDVGKLKVPRDILEKESALSGEEMALMKKHSEFGIELATGYGLPQEVLDVIIQHHERLDASGYPYGLKADQISRLAKIAMIADVIDAITSSRPYRPARGMETAIQIVRQEGAKFCTEYVDIIDELYRASSL